MKRPTTHKHKMTTCHSKRKARRKNWKQFDRHTSLLAHAAKREKIIESASAAVVVGVIKFSGSMFGGDHEVLCLNRDGEKHIMLDVDGAPFRPTTYRGVLRLLSERLVRKNKQQGKL